MRIHRDCFACLFFTNVDINECEGNVSPCDVNAQCYNNQGSYYCECNVGYNGNGKVCNGESISK